MSKLLRGKRVFLDTQVFRKARFAVGSPAFRKLSALCKDSEVLLVTTSITRREIEAQIDKLAPEIKAILGKAGSFIVGLGLPELTIQGNVASTISEAEIAVLLKDSVETFFRDCNVEQIEFPAGALDSVLDLYFSRRPPFGTEKKKAEFPDAFVLEALKSQIGRHGQSIYVISEDPDFENACKESPQLERLPTISHFLNLWNVHSETIKQVRTTLRANAAIIHETLDRIIEGLSGEMDCPGSVKISHRKIVDILEELVISCDDANASVVFICYVEFVAWLEIHPASDAPYDYRCADTGQTVSVTLDFRFDPTNAKVFEVQTFWAPQTITFSAHQAI